ncbi:uncharacterized protein LOC123273937 [Cotesia glomerata]|uniref:uncharacterized protein LOC123273937 n=1 Tax=Cotesia glomerata TaxID=32391 RepID=UPI001D0159EE|nr:uncharacterized protein LOC123273937 [Cotesia glomerata]
MTAVEHVIKQPPLTNKYQALKEALTNKYAVSQENQFRTLISDLQLTGKPSELYEQMRRHGSNLNKSFIRTLWMDRLPQDLQIVLAVTEPMEMKSLTQLADKIVELLDRRRQSQNQFVNAISKANNHNSCEDQIKKLSEQIQALSTKMDSVFSQLNSHQSRGRSRSNDSRPRSHGPGNRNQKTCYFHQKFGPKALKCNPPCIWSELLTQKQGNEVNHQ